MAVDGAGVDSNAQVASSLVKALQGYIDSVLAAGSLATADPAETAAQVPLAMKLAAVYAQLYDRSCCTRLAPADGACKAGRDAGRCSARAAGACCGGRDQGMHPGVAAGHTMGRRLPALPGDACGALALLPAVLTPVTAPLTASTTDAGHSHLHPPILQAYAAADAFLAALQPHILADEVPSPAPEVVQVRSQHLRSLHTPIKHCEICIWTTNR